tara:strand:- start:4798 stop:5685 length:888 start_codon:yes stop_codon:yes gene_type:complete
MPTSRKPAFEKVSAAFGTSFNVKFYNDPSPQEKPPFWHFHPEVELVYVKGGKGMRHIGHHLSYYQEGDLVMIGSMLPHAGFTDRLTGNESETVIQFKPDCFGPEFFQLAEMHNIRQLLELSKSGISFKGETKVKVGALMEALVTKDKFSKVLDLLKVLNDLAQSEEYELLNAAGYVFEVEHSDNDRINVIYDYVQKHFQQSISLEEISDIANMTVPSFCRYFKKISGKTFTHFVNEIRIMHACKLLSEEQQSVSEVSFESGFNNFSHFNRQFKEITQKSPSEYRKQFFQILKDEE